MSRLARTVLALTLIMTMPPLAAGQRATPLPEDANDAAVGADSTPDLSGVTPLPLTGERRAALDAFITRNMAACPLPGLSVVVVQDRAVVDLEGFGVRESGRSAPVTPDTLLRIGSVTKPITTMMAGTLVDAGLVEWETPAVTLLPDLALTDPDQIARLTLADRFSGATGLPRRDLELVFEADAYTPPRLIASRQDLPLTERRGERFQYSNQAFAAGGYAAAAAGAAPDDRLAGYLTAVQHRVLNPIGMAALTFDLQAVVRSSDYAVPHSPGLDGITRPLSLLAEERFVASVPPAGGMWSLARDMADTFRRSSPTGWRQTAAGSSRPTISARGGRGPLFRLIRRCRRPSVPV